MRLINKQAAPTALDKWKAAKPTATFATLDNTLKQNLKNSLLTEQHFVCCYCENEINPNNSHIEHLHPQSKYPKEQLDYANLMASCEADKRKAHCGHKKDKHPLPISPLGPDDPAPNFIYSADGNVYPCPNTNHLADKAISVLGLNAHRLVNMRKAAISALLDQPIESWAQIAGACTYPDAKNKLPAYNSAILYQLKAAVATA